MKRSEREPSPEEQQALDNMTPAEVADIVYHETSRVDKTMFEVYLASVTFDDPKDE